MPVRPLSRFVDIKRILRNMRHAQMEQQPNPKTGERMVPPSVKLAAWVALVVVAGALLWVGAAQFSDSSDGAGGALDTGDDGSGGSGNETTESSPQPEAAAEQPTMVPAGFASADR